MPSNESYFPTKAYAKKEIILTDISGTKFRIESGDVMYLTGGGMFMEYNVPRFGTDIFFYWDSEINFDDFFDNFMCEQEYKKWIRKEKLENITKLEID